ncbi:hypothetical protein M427DRAFT_28781 [Gonapodya prolifera JEL478]|uniref:Uncharacterized protein n=1 Tax=Gonapodya prolifera (strain JEL478) TaxID=1344416 RepID=A0A139AT52_GONPJ|nr:hypothetical protein M427DRAFT_28781 [Gonapodya prolifera JEL478]|eukprot:KXS19912.1 hypothetical protein M427DRAFT_28781 [Gonapodya prolifera JEL478]
MSRWTHPLSHLSQIAHDDTSDTASVSDAEQPFFSDVSVRFLDAARDNNIDAIKELLPAALAAIQPHHLFKYGRHPGSRSHPVSVADAALPEPFVLHAAALLAIQHRNIDALKLLLAAPVPPNNISSSLDPNDWAPLDHPIRAFFPQRLVDQRSPATLLTWASADPDATACARLLLQHGANPNAKDGKGRSPLVFAAWNEAADTVRLLHDHRASLDERNGDNAWTALHYACKGGRSDVVRILVELGAALDIIDKEKRLPKDVALAEGRDDVVKILEWAADPVVGPLLRLPARDDPDVTEFRDRVTTHRDAQLSNKEPERPAEDDEAAVERAVAESPQSDPTLTPSSAGRSSPSPSLTPPAAPLEKAVSIRMSTIFNLVQWLDLARTHVASRRSIGLELESVVASISSTCSFLDAEQASLAQRVAQLEDHRGACQAAVARAETDVRSSLATELGETVGNPIKEANEKILAGVTAKIAQHRTSAARCAEKQALLRRVADVAEAVMEELEADILRCERGMVEASARLVERATSFYAFLGDVADKAERAKEDLVASMASCERRAVLARDGGLDRWADDLEEERRRCAQYLNDSVGWVETIRGHMARLRAVQVAYMEVGEDGKVYYGDTVPAVRDDMRVDRGSHKRARTPSASRSPGPQPQHIPTVVYRYKTPDGCWAHFYVDDNDREVHFDPHSGEQWVYDAGASLAGTSAADEFADLGSPVDIPESEREERKKKAERIRAASRAAAARTAVVAQSKFDSPLIGSKSGANSHGNLLSNAKVVTIKRQPRETKEMKAKPSEKPHGPKSSPASPSLRGRGQDAKEKELEKEIIRRFLHQEAAGSSSLSATETSSDETTGLSADELLEHLRHARGRSRSTGRSKTPRRSESPSATSKKPHSRATSENRRSQVKPPEMQVGPSHSSSHMADGFHVHIHNGEKENGIADFRARRRAWEGSGSTDSDQDTIFIGTANGHVREYITPKKAMKVLGTPAPAKGSKGEHGTSSPATGNPSAPATVGGAVYKNYITVSGAPSRLAKNRVTPPSKAKEPKGKSKYVEEDETFGPMVVSPWGYPSPPPMGYPGLFMGGYGPMMTPAPPQMMYPPHVPQYPPPPPLPHAQPRYPRGRMTPEPGPTSRAHSRFLPPQSRPNTISYAEYDEQDTYEQQLADEGYEAYSGELDTYDTGYAPRPAKPAVRTTPRPVTPSRPASPHHPGRTTSSTAHRVAPPPTPAKPPSLRAAAPVPRNTVVRVSSPPQHQQQVGPSVASSSSSKPVLHGDFERAESQIARLYGQFLVDHGDRPSRSSPAPAASPSNVVPSRVNAHAATASGPQVAAQSTQSVTRATDDVRVSSTRTTNPVDWVAVAEEEHSRLYQEYLHTHRK